MLSSFSGVLQGYLSAGNSSILIDGSCFEVGSIALDGMLGQLLPTLSRKLTCLRYIIALDDSGSWVARDGKLCGYILARMAEQPRAYMTPIEPILRDICQVFSFDRLVSVEVPSIQILSRPRHTALSPKSSTSVTNRSKPSPIVYDRASNTILPSDDSDAVVLKTKLKGNRPAIPLTRGLPTKGRSTSNTIRPPKTRDELSLFNVANKRWSTPL